MKSEENKSTCTIQLKNISVRYGTLEILKNISISLKPSETHAIVGEHGAGKTSICRVLCGLIQPTSGELIIDGITRNDLTLESARNLGIEYVSQHNPLFDNFSVADNLFAAEPPLKRKIFREQKKIILRAKEFLKALEIDLDPYAPVGKLKLSDRVLVDIMKHLQPSTRLLILDEALQKLTSQDQIKVIERLKKLKTGGTSILFVTHRIDDIYNLAEVVSVIKSGELLLSDSVLNIDKINLIKLAYTQISNTNLTHVTRDYYRLLKYNAAVLEELPVNLIVIDPDKNIMLLNSHAQRYFSTSQNKAVGNKLRTLLAENQKAYEVTSYGIKSRKSESFYHIPLVVAEGERIVNIRVTPIKDVSFIIGYSIFIEDVTEEEHLRNQIILSENLSSIGLLSAGVAHEINNPLEILLNSLQYLRYRDKTEESTIILEDMEEEIKAISDIIGNLITFSTKQLKDTEKVDVNLVISGLLRLLRFNAELNNIQIHFLPCEENPETFINKTELRQVLLNLIKNSIEAMPSGGTITIETGLNKKKGEQEIFFLVRDTGIGIPEEDINDIFLPFYSSKQNNGSGKGLGLSVSYGIIKKYNGTITVRNLDEGGCEFIIRLPKGQ